MTETKARRRAPGMSPEQRREMIVKVALPLVAERGAAVTTAEVAKAAAIGEATIFRVFADKEELLNACVLEALNPAHVLEEIGAVPLDQPLAARLTEAAEALRAHLDRMGSVIGALHASGVRRGRPDPYQRGPEPGKEAGRGAPAAGGGTEAKDGGHDRPVPLGRDASAARTVEAVADLFEPERDSLRLPPERLAAIFLGMLFSRPRFPVGTAPAGLDELVDVFLNGAVR
ncbi:helix-turn-helix domain-containing protein [Sphaerisporangium sp. NPDC088356]|uniref:TetR/AcrR family transcriptional regulator n=1 Tax=Sphaerisporangium sp. NPDC088356 TaxID=3154871 RepID=UPI00342BC6A5